MIMTFRKNYYRNHQKPGEKTSHAFSRICDDVFSKNYARLNIIFKTFRIYPDDEEGPENMFAINIYIYIYFKNEKNNYIYIYIYAHTLKNEKDIYIYINIYY